MSDMPKEIYADEYDINDNFIGRSWGHEPDDGIKYHHDDVVQKLKASHAELLETVEGLSANAQVLINVIENPEGGSDFAKQMVLLIAKSTIEDAQQALENAERWVSDGHNNRILVYTNDCFNSDFFMGTIWL